MSKKNKINKAFTLSPATCESLKALSILAGMDQSAVVDGCIQATWAAIVSGGFRQLPSAVEALEVTGQVGGSYYIRGVKAGNNDRET